MSEHGGEERNPPHHESKKQKDTPLVFDPGQREQQLIRAIQAERVKSLRYEADALEMRQCLKAIMSGFGFTKNSPQQEHLLRRSRIALKSVDPGRSILLACDKARKALDGAAFLFDEAGCGDENLKKELVEAKEALDNI